MDILSNDKVVEKELRSLNPNKVCAFKNMPPKVLKESRECCLDMNACARASFLIKLQAGNFIKKEVLAQVFSSEFCEISKNTFFAEYLLATAS